MWQCEDKLNRKADHFRLSSVAQKRRLFKLSNMSKTIKRHTEKSVRTLSPKTKTLSTKPLVRGILERPSILKLQGNPSEKDPG